MTEMEKEKVLSAALAEAQVYWALNMDDIPAADGHKLAFRAVMQLAVALGAATDADKERIWKEGRRAAEDLAAWAAEERQRKAAEGAV